MSNFCLKFLLPISALVFNSCAEISSEPPASSEIRDAELMAAIESPSSTKVQENAIEPVKTQPGSMTSMPLEQFFQLQQTSGALIYDVRPGFVYAFGHVPGAISWPKRSYTSKLSQIEPDILAANRSGKPVVLYCTDAECPDSRTVAGWLTERGLDVYVLEGGWAAWKEGDLPTE